MNSELNFEIAPFEWTAGVKGESEIQAFDELGDLETGEEFERGGRRFARGSVPASRRLAPPSRSKPAARGPVRVGGSKMRPPMRPPRPKPRPRPSRLGSWGPAGVLVRDPYSSISEPFPIDSTSSAPGTEVVRWAQDCLNHVMRLRLAVNGVMGVDTRSALRRFQGQQGLRVSGILGPDTEEALKSACRGDEAAAQAEAEFYVSEEAEIPAIPAENSPKFKPFRDNTVEAIKRITSKDPGESIKTWPYIPLGNLRDLVFSKPELKGGGLYLLVFTKDGRRRAYSGMTFNFQGRLRTHRKKMKPPQNYRVYIFPVQFVNKLRALERAIHVALGVPSPSSVLINPQPELEEEELLGSGWN
ncbi:peptidoglycan-binding protein [Nitrosospira sp. Nsp1]|uniref:peptidoglycan-binding protein n=1 Tax=Nitrosospira sp. Nsp1 TaxID=136547 RepID=UPI000890433C|nr:peptidoglycan-binding protein [Nitrosospira sp. Nsp1]SCX40976.1 Putative peptidoglycan binding domain-containing protein [Nitrosospira sp. Nsp1]